MRAQPSKNGHPEKKKASTEEKLQSTTFPARPSQIARWKARAAQEQRSYGWWIRHRLEEADARDEELVARVAERES